MGKKMMCFTAAALLIVFVLTGCIYNKPRTKNVNDTADGNTGGLEPAARTITVWSVDGDYIRRADSKCFKNIQDRVSASVTYIPNTQYEMKLRVAISSTELPDIIAVDSPNVAAYAISGAIIPLNDYWDSADRDDLIPSVVESWTYNGKIWGAQWEETNCVVFYNKDMFREAGLSAPQRLEDSWNWEQIRDVAVKLTKKDNEGNILVYGILPLMAGPNIAHEGQNYVSNTWTWQAGADIISPDGTTVEGYFNSEKSLKSLKFFGELFTKYKVAPVSEIPNGFQSGRIAMWITGPWEISTFKKNKNINWGAMPLPHDKKWASNDGGWGYSVTVTCRDIPAAMEVIMAKTGKEGQKISLSESMLLPNRKSLFNSLEYLKEPPYPMILEQLQKTAKARPKTPAYPVIAESLQKCFNDVAYGKDPETAMKEYSARIEKVLIKVNTRK